MVGHSPSYRLVWEGLRIATSFAVLVGAAWLGRAVIALTHWPLPSSLIGMLGLFGLLATGVVKLSWVEPAARLLLGTMALFFVPPAVGIVEHLDVLAREWPALIVGTALATGVFIVLLGRAVERKN